MRELPSGTVTFLFTDIEGSTRLLEQLGGEYAQVLDEHRRLIRIAAASHAGTEVDTQGDAFLLAFTRASDAVEAAMAAQRALAHTPVRVRMGIHTGEPSQTTEGYVGVDLHRGARVMAAGHGGQVLLSQMTRELVGNVAVRDLGEHRLKDLSEPLRLYQLVAEDLPSDFPPLRTLENRPTNLPVQPTPLVGRERELDEVLELLSRDHVRLATLTGPGGSGKTRLALQAAAELVERYPDGVWFVNLAALTDPELVVPTIAQTLELREQPGQTIEETLAQRLHEQELLLVLDNFEQVAEAAPKLAELLAHAPRLNAIVTSRVSLHVQAEHEYDVPPLADEEALALFAERARAVKSSFSLNGNRPLVAEICRRLDQLPLAIELAAARIKLLPEQALLERLDDRLKLLTGGARDLDERQRTLRAAIDWSHDLLSEQEQTLFRRLAVFAGGRTLEAIEAVCDPDGELDVFEGIASLVDKNLLRREEADEGEPRFVMLETIHEYASEQLAERGEAEQLRRRHCEYFVALAEQAEPGFLNREQGRRLRQFDAELENVRAALTWALSAGEPELALRLASALEQYWDSTGKSSEALRWLSAALAHEDGLGDELRGRALLAYGAVANRLSECDAAERSLVESLRLFRELGDVKGQARSLFQLAHSLVQRGDLQRAHPLAEQAVALGRAAGDHWALSAALNVQGGMALERGEYEQARALIEEAVEGAEQAGDFRDAAIGRVGLAEAMLLGGDADAAASTLPKVLSGLEEFGDTHVQAYALRLLGLALLEQGKPEDAHTPLRQALSLAAAVGDQRITTDCLLAMGAVAAAFSRPELAARLWGAAEAGLETGTHALFAVDRQRYERSLPTAKAQLSEQVWEKAWNEGRSMTLEQAILCSEEQWPRARLRPVAKGMS